MAFVQLPMLFRTQCNLLNGRILFGSKVMTLWSLWIWNEFVIKRMKMMLGEGKRRRRWSLIRSLGFVKILFDLSFWNLYTTFLYPVFQNSFKNRFVIRIYSFFFAFFWKTLGKIKVSLQLSRICKNSIVATDLNFCKQIFYTFRLSSSKDSYEIWFLVCCR